MENSVVTQLENALSAFELESKKDESYQLLNQANDFYNKLIDEGVIKKRGYTLRGIEDAHLFQNKFKQ